MSGRAKNGRPVTSHRPAFAITDDEEFRVRQLIRELHEAAKDARAAAKELDAKMNRYGGSVAKHYKRIINERDERLTAEMDGHVKMVHEIAEEHRDQWQTELAKHLGCSDGDELLTRLTISLAEATLPVIEKSARKAMAVKTFRAIVIDEIARSLSSESTEQAVDRHKAALALIERIQPF